MLSYVELLESFMKYTPSDHVDRKNLTQAIAKFKDLDSLFRQVKIKLNIRNILNYVFNYIFFFSIRLILLHFSQLLPPHP